MATNDQTWLETLYQHSYDTISINPHSVQSDIPASANMADRDALANRYIWSAAATSGAAGLVTGLGGMITLPVTVPADVGTLTSTLIRLAQRLSLVYGQDFRKPADEATMWVLFAGALGVDVLKDASIRAVVVQAQQFALKTPFTRSVILTLIRKIGLMLGVRLTHKSIAQLVPVLGGLVGGGMNFKMVREAGDHIKDGYRRMCLAGNRI